MADADILFRVHRSQLLAALTAVTEAVAKKDTIPILNNVLLRPEGERLFLRGTNLDIEIEAGCDLVSAGRDAAITIGSKELYSITRNMPESAEITFEAGRSDGQVVVRGGRSRYSLNILPAGDFPSMSDTHPERAFSIGAATLATAFGKVLYAVENDDNDRFYLMGVYIHPTDDGRMAVVGCDGKNLAVVRTEPQDMRAFPGVIIPTKTVSALKKLFDKTKAACVVSVSDAKIVFECDDLTIVSKLVDGTFPDYPRLIPARTESYVRADKDVMRGAIGRACLISNDTSREALRLSVSEGSVQLQQETRDGEEGSESVDVEYDGDAFVIGFNGTFLGNLLGSIQTSSFRMHVSDPQAPGHFTPDSDADEDYILMPMRV